MSTLNLVYKLETGEEKKFTIDSEKNFYDLERLIDTQENLPENYLFIHLEKDMATSVPLLEYQTLSSAGIKDGDIFICHFPNLNDTPMSVEEWEKGLLLDDDAEPIPDHAEES